MLIERGLLDREKGRPTNKLAFQIGCMRGSMVLMRSGILPKIYMIFLLQDMSRRCNERFQITNSLAFFGALYC